MQQDRRTGLRALPGLALAGVLALGGATLSATSASAATTCSVDYNVANQWGGGFTANVTLTNEGDALDAWTLEWDFPASGQQVGHGWGANFSQSGSHVTVTGKSWNAALGAGESVSVGFNGTYSGANPVPDSFSVNGTPCGNGDTGGGDDGGDGGDNGDGDGDNGDDGGGTQPPAEHVDNPFVGATRYVNPDYTALANQSAGQVSSETLAAKMRKVGQQPTAVWMDRIAAISGDRDRMGLREHLNTALEQKQSGQPIVFEAVIYDLPGRDCHAAASNGELPPTEEGFNRYKNEYIDPIVDILNDEKYEDIRIVLTIEPDSLPNLVTNAGGSGEGRTSDPDCVEVKEEGWYVNGIQYALNQFDEISNVYSYLDIGHSAWLGWENNVSPAVELYASVVEGVPNAGMDAIDGFATNVANYTPTKEPFLTDPSLQVGGQPIKSATFYQWNPVFDETDYVEALNQAFQSAGLSDIGFLIDTGRNGWGGDYRPTQLDESPTTVDGYVNANRVDQRPHRGLWCNQKQAGIGQRPTANPSGSPEAVDAFVWTKPPGESDGASSPENGTEDRVYDPHCDPDLEYEQYGTNTNSLPGAPGAGLWFHEQFTMLVQNAYPEIQP